MTKKDQCECGNLKDSRALKCRSCNYGYNETTKICVKCKIQKPYDQFRIRTRKIPRPRSTCRECESYEQRLRSLNATDEQKQQKEYLRRKWERDNPEKHILVLKKRRIRSLGLEDQMDDILPLLDIQKECIICKVTPYESLNIDHCHKTGKFRGMLCSNCNHGLGHFRDDPQLLQNAINYLCQ